MVLPPISVVTRANFPAPPAQVWKGLLFYEAIGQPPPFYLRLLLPVPLRTEGKPLGVGDEVMCWYQRGHLLKRITGIEPGDFYEFEVAEQALAFGGGLRLTAGRFALRELSHGRTEVAVETRYRSSRAPRWFWTRVERVVCQSFHRYLLGSMRRRMASP